MAELNAYNEALGSGQYQKPGNLTGKYDNVRRLWEDEQLAIYLRPHLEPAVDRQTSKGKKLRILDLGCGSGDGFEFIAGIYRTDTPLISHDSKIISPKELEIYKGVDINNGLLGQASTVFGSKPYMEFVHSDVNDLDFGAERPYDLYLANYGTLSHNEDQQTIDMLTRIANHGKNGAIIAIDWLGRYSYEWQTLWTNNLEENRWMDYVVSYIYAGNNKDKQKLTSFPLRIMGRSEVHKIYRQARKKSGNSLVLKALSDRSTYVGRHIDTARYNRHAQPIRRLVNSLFEPNTTTELEKLLIKYVPKDGFDIINTYHQNLANWWNYLVISTMAYLAQDAPPQAPRGMPNVVRKAVSTMKKMVKASHSMGIGNPRASLVEPQLGYCLRELEIGLQKGLGCGHGLVAIFEIVK